MTSCSSRFTDSGGGGRRVHGCPQPGSPDKNKTGQRGRTDTQGVLLIVCSRCAERLKAAVVPLPPQVSLSTVSDFLSPRRALGLAGAETAFAGWPSVSRH